MRLEVYRLVEQAGASGWYVTLYRQSATYSSLGIHSFNPCFIVTVTPGSDRYTFEVEVRNLPGLDDKSWDFDVSVRRRQFLH